jgi:membrane-associated phospholipid phosphatase
MHGGERGSHMIRGHAMRSIRLAGVVLCAFMFVSRAGGEAYAQSIDDVDTSYLVDGGAIPFLWIPLVGSLAMDRWVSPRAEPLLFSRTEGGGPSELDAELPGYLISAGAAALAAILFVDGDDSRWYHLKGFGEAIATTSLMTGAAKRLFGRHRPDHGNNTDGEAGKSFPSGHASQTGAAVTYFALYLREHGFRRWREPGTTPWWEVGAYAALGALAIAVPAERVYHGRHHLTDVVVGSLLGAATSVAFFLWQEHRFDTREPRADDTLGTGRARRVQDEPSLPPVDAPQVQLGWSF